MTDFPVSHLVRVIPLRAKVARIHWLLVLFLGLAAMTGVAVR